VATQSRTGGVTSGRAYKRLPQSDCYVNVRCGTPWPDSFDECGVLWHHLGGLVAYALRIAAIAAGADRARLPAVLVEVQTLT